MAQRSLVKVKRRSKNNNNNNNNNNDDQIRGLVEQLAIARENIAELQQQLIDFNEIFENYKKSEERKVPISIEFLYHQILFLMQANERFVNMVIKNNKMVRLEAIEDDNG